MSGRLHGVGRRFQRLYDLRLRLGLRQFSCGLFCVGWTKILCAKRNFRIVLHRAGIGRRIGEVRCSIHELKGVKRRHRVGKTSRSQRQRGLETGEGSRLHSFLVSDLDGRWDLEGLFVRDDVDRPKEPIALGGVHAPSCDSAGRAGAANSGASAKSY